jgi:diacylglycerol O-acyltransferase / wax synthase
MFQLSGQDAAMFQLESAEVKTHFTVVTIYDQSTAPGGKLGYREILAYFDEVMAGLPIFRRKIREVPFGLDAPYLVDDPDFHIESHIKHIALPAPYDWRQFCILAAQIQAMPIDSSKPLWDMHVIEGLNNVDGLPAGSFAILTRMQHSLADGDTVRGLLGALHQPAGKRYRTKAKYVAELAPSTLKVVRRACLNNLRQGFFLESKLAKRLPIVGKAVGLAAVHRVERLFEKHELEHEDTHVPLTPFNKPLEYRRVFQATTLNLNTLKKIRRVVEDATINDVVIALIGGAMHRYLKAVGEQADGDLFAMCPVNQRENKFSNSSEFGNNISLMRANMHSSEEDAQARLKKIVEETRASKKIQKASSTKELMELSENIPNLFVAAAAKLVLPFALRRIGSHPVANATISNVPGPQEPLYFMGAKMLMFTGVAPLVPGMGMTIASTSYNGGLTIGISACPSWVSDPQKLIGCVRESYVELAALAGCSEVETAVMLSMGCAEMEGVA